MSGLEKKKVYPIPTSGFNTKISPMLLSDQEATVLQNARMADTGLLEKYPGYIKDGSPFPNATASFIRMLLNFKRGTTVDYLILAAEDDSNTNTNYKVDFKKTVGDGTYQYIGHTIGTAGFTSGSTAVTGSGTSWSSQLKAGDKIKATADSDSAYVEIQNVLSDTSLTLISNYGATHAAAAYTARIIWNYTFVPRGVVFNNKAILTNGAETPMSYDATTVALLTNASAPKARYVEVHKNRVFMANTSSDPSSIFWSSANDETVWDAAAAEPVSSAADGGTIIAIRSFADSLIVFKNTGTASSVYQVVGNFDQSATGEVDYIRKLDCPDNIGIISERTPVNHKGYLYFLSETGLYRMDQRMFIEKVTYATDGTLNTANFALGPSQSKSFSFSSQPTWQAGTLTGLKATSSGALGSYFDEYTITNVTQGNGLASCALDSIFNVHVAYVDSSNTGQIKYVKIAVDGTQTTQTVVTESYAIGALSLAIDSGNNPGIAYCAAGLRYTASWNTGAGDPGFPGGTGYVPVKYVVSASGVWGAAVSVVADGSLSQPGTDPGNGLFQNAEGTHYLNFNDVSLFFSGTTPWIAFSSRGEGVWAAPTGHGTSFTSESSTEIEVFNNTGVWSRVKILNQSWTTDGSGPWGFGSFPDTYINVGLILNNSANPRVIGYWPNGGYLSSFKSDDGGASWSTVENFTTGAPVGRAQLSLNAAGNLVTGYVDNADTEFKKRNHTTATTTTIDATTGQWGNGYVISSITSADQDYGYNTIGTSPNQAEKYWFESGSSISNNTLNTTSKTYKTSDRPFVINGNVFASVAFGSSANTIKVNRISFRGVWQSPQESDSTLTAWGTYEVTNQAANSATITHQVALSSTNPASVFNNIGIGSIISSDPTQVFVIAKITMVLGGWSAPTIDAISLKYTGLGVDAKQAIGYVFNNELFVAYAQQSSSSNGYVLVSDINDGLLLLTYPVSAIERFKNKLYAGRATNGDLLILKQGYNFDGASYSLDVQSREDFLDSIDLQKSFTRAYILFKTQNQSSFTFQWRVDNFAGSADAAWNSTTIDGTAYGIADVKIGAFGRSFQWRITDTNKDDTLQLAGVVLLYGYASVR